MRDGLRGGQRRKYRTKRSSFTRNPVAETIFDRKFELEQVAEPNQARVSYITCATDLYLAVVLDLAARVVVAGPCPILLQGTAVLKARMAQDSRTSGPSGIPTGGLQR